ncbi:MAG TPA: tetratricopeptide repeat protein [Kofleriaceae bacterium]|nr:tetratricopeptide repeat protein [Kofleriaceae bacterium]
MNRCPSPVELERAYWTEGKAARVHALTCARCSSELAEIEALVAGGRALEPSPQAAERREEIRTTVLASQARAAAPERRRPRWWQVAPVAAAAAAALVWFLWPRGGQETAEVAGRRGSVMAHGDARYMLLSPQPDEIVRLVDGTLTVQVDTLSRGQRFRVITADGEVEVVGTAFDVTAEEDRLVGVRVMHGVVHVRDAAGQAHVLQAGEAWKPPARDAVVRPPPAPAIEPPPDPVSPRTAPPARAIQQQPPVPPAPPSVKSEAQKALDEGWTALRAERFDEAASAFARSLASGPSKQVAEDASYWQSVALARAGQAAKAARSFERFLAGYPRSTRAGEASAMLGWILFDARDYAGAARRFRAALADPSARVRKSATDGLNALRQAGQR